MLIFSKLELGETEHITTELTITKPQFLWQSSSVGSNRGLWLNEFERRRCSDRAQRLKHISNIFSLLLQLFCLGDELFNVITSSVNHGKGTITEKRHCAAVFLSISRAWTHTDTNILTVCVCVCVCVQNAT